MLVVRQEQAVVGSIAERIITAVEVITRDKQWDMSLSVGLLWSDSIFDVNRLLTQSAGLMYQAKKTGNGKIVAQEIDLT